MQDQACGILMGRTSAQLVLRPSLLGHGLATCVEKLLTKTHGVEDKCVDRLANVTTEMKISAGVPATRAQAPFPRALSTCQAFDHQPGYVLRSMVTRRASGERLVHMPVDSVAVVCARCGAGHPLTVAAGEAACQRHQARSLAEDRSQVSCWVSTSFPWKDQAALAWTPRQCK